MNQVNTNKKPFGLTISVKFALEAMKESVAPSSVILGNLFYLQKSNTFPKDLDKTFFSFAKYQPNDNEKKIIGHLLDSFRKPNVNQEEILEKTFIDGWVKKIPPQPTKPLAKVQPKKVGIKNKAPKQQNKKEAPVAPTIIIKKNRAV